MKNGGQRTNYFNPSHSPAVGNSGPTLFLKYHIICLNIVLPGRESQLGSLRNIPFSGMVSSSNISPMSKRQVSTNKTRPYIQRQ